MPRTIYEHDIRCNTEGCSVTRWLETTTLLTACPNDAAHEVLEGSGRILGMVSENTVSITKEVGFSTNQHYWIESFGFDVPGNGSATLTTSWPLLVGVQTMKACVPAGGVGCRYSAVVGPKTPVGAITPTALAIGDTVVSVSPTVVQHADPGYYVGVYVSGVHTYLGMVVARGSSTITLRNASTVAAPAGSVITVEARPCTDFELGAVGIIPMGEDRTASMPLPANLPVVSTMTNPNPDPVRIILYVSLAY